MIELVDFGAPNLWGHFKYGVLRACDEVCFKKRWRSKGDTWWWNEEVKEDISRKKDVHKTMCWNSTEKNKRVYKVKNKAKKAASKALREKADEAHTELKGCPNVMFRLVQGLKTDSKEVGGRCERK